MSRVFQAFSDGILSLGDRRMRCALGKAGVVAATAKREGDQASPAGQWPLRRVFYRPDRLAAPVTGLAVVALQPDDGWCDDPSSPDYNRLVKRPFDASHEVLWREDQVYDVIVELGYNDAPVEPGRGSAIFMHVARHDYSGTEGCVALDLSDLLTLLAVAEPGYALDIRA